MDTIFAIMTGRKPERKPENQHKQAEKYFPKNTTPKQMEEAIIKLFGRECRETGRGTAANLLSFQEVNAENWYMKNERNPV